MNGNPAEAMRLAQDLHRALTASLFLSSESQAEYAAELRRRDGDHLAARVSWLREAWLPEAQSR